jgi:hypothetical protein
MKTIALAALAALPLVGGCYATVQPGYYYARPSHVRVYGPPAVYVAPRPVYVAPPRVRVYW